MRRVELEELIRGMADSIRYIILPDIQPRWKGFYWKTFEEIKLKENVKI